MRRIGTHSGTFHCDEALAVFMLRTLPAWKGAVVVRSRDEAELNSCDIQVDVGGVYDAAALRFDHHQRGFEQYFGEFKSTKLSSAGLIYRHYGMDVLRAVLGDAVDVSKIYSRVYSEFIEGVDAIDNGVTQYDGGKRIYKNHTDLGSRVGRLNPRWNEPKEGFDENERFFRAVELTGEEFVHAAKDAAFSWLPGRSIVERCMASRRSFHESGEILLLDQFCPWGDHLFECERVEGPDAPKIKYIIFADTGGASWRVRAAPLESESFKNRLPLPEPWRGLRDAELDAATGINGCVFVHATGFIGGNHTREGALAMAVLALSWDAKSSESKRPKVSEQLQ
jgi:uncharacterized UPF0160 family protein